MSIRAMLAASLLMVPLCTPPRAEAQAPETLWALMGRETVPTFETLRGEMRLAVFTLDIPDASPAPIVTISDVSVQMPDRISLQVISPTPDGDGALVSDGEQLTVVSHILGQVTQGPAPSSVQNIGADVLALTGQGGLLLPGILGIPNPLIARLAGDEDKVLGTAEPTEHMGALCETSVIEIRSGGAVERLTVAFDPESGLPVWAELEQTSSQGIPWLRMTEAFTDLEIDSAIPPDAFTVEIPEGLVEVPALDPATPEERSAQSAR